MYFRGIHAYGLKKDKDVKMKKILFISLGCDKNLVDTEKMMGLLGREGFAFTDREGEAQVIIVTTCCFIGDAKE